MGVQYKYKCCRLSDYNVHLDLLPKAQQDLGTLSGISSLRHRNSVLKFFKYSFNITDCLKFGSYELCRYANC